MILLDREPDRARLREEHENVDLTIESPETQEYCLHPIPVFKKTSWGVVISTFRNLTRTPII